MFFYVSFPKKNATKGVDTLDASFGQNEGRAPESGGLHSSRSLVFLYRGERRVNALEGIPWAFL